MNDGKESIHNANNSKEATPKFRSVHIDPCKPRSGRLTTPDNNLSLGDSLTKPIGANQFGNVRWVVETAKPIPVWGLERGTVKIDDEPLYVSARIDHFLLQTSVKVKFDKDQAEAKCETSDHLQYEIHLYAAPNNGTHVEVMKLVGCASAFRNERQSIISAAMGKGSVGKAPRITKKLAIPSNLTALYVAPNKNKLENDLERATDQLHSPDRNMVLFTLQDLSFTTNSEKAHSLTAHNKSLLIMQNNTGIRDIILSIYASEANNTNIELSRNICNACLYVFINGILSMTKNKNVLDQNYQGFINELIPCLMCSLNNLECVHNACLALKCLSLLLNHSQMACLKVQETNIGNIAKEAIELGRREHLQLEEAARSMIDTLQSKLVVV